MTPLRSLLLILSLVTLGCGGAQRIDPGPRGTLRFTGEPRDAALTVDEVHLGPIHMFEQKGLLLRPGSHNVVVRAEGYFPEYRIVELGEGEVVVVEIELRPEPE